VLQVVREDSETVHPAQLVVVRLGGEEGVKMVQARLIA
jgi:hypothetical protein